jgi:hypothetical protein
MRRISGYFISLMIISCSLTIDAQDSIKVPLNIRAALDLFGPISYYTNRNNLSFEGFISMERNSKKSYILEVGYQDFKYSQYNYSYSSKGTFIRGGIDYNFIKPFIAEGKYYAGLGFRYGLSLYSSQIPFFKHDNYWGTGTAAVGSSVHLAHFIEVSPGIKTEILKNISIGWNIRLRIMIYPGTGKDLKPVSVPGFGNGAKTFSPGINYYIIFNFPYKSVFAKPEVVKTPEKETGSVNQ